MISNNVMYVIQEMKKHTNELESLYNQLEPDEVMVDDEIEDSDEAEFIKSKVRSYEIIMIPDTNIERSIGVSPIKKFNDKWIQGIYSLDTSYEYPNWELSEIHIYNE